MTNSGECSAVDEWSDVMLDDGDLTLLGNESECPRCHKQHSGRFYGPCEDCRSELRAKMSNEARLVDVAEYEPKMNVTPNAVALKES